MGAIPVAVMETKIPKNVFVTQNIVLNNHFIEHIPTESSAGVPLLHIANIYHTKFTVTWKFIKNLS